MNKDSLDGLNRRLREFARARDWEQFHSPKNLSMALIAEAAELVEHFQWLTEEESLGLSDEKRQEVALEHVALGVGVLAVVSLGLSAGALLAEASVLVPFWRAQNPEAFLSWYRQHSGLLLRFFGPLEVASGLFVLGATLFAWLGFGATMQRFLRTDKALRVFNVSMGLLLAATVLLVF